MTESEIREKAEQIMMKGVRVYGQHIQEFRELVADLGDDRIHLVEFLRSWLRSGDEGRITRVFFYASHIPFPELESDLLALASIPEDFYGEKRLPVRGYEWEIASTLRWIQGEASLDYLKKRALLWADEHWYYRGLAGRAIAALTGRDLPSYILGLRRALEYDAKHNPGLDLHRERPWLGEPVSLVPMITLLKEADPDKALAVGQGLSDCATEAKRIALHILRYYCEFDSRGWPVAEAFEKGLGS